jgi:hypothetical protein
MKLHKIRSSSLVAILAITISVNLTNLVKSEALEMTSGVSKLTQSIKTTTKAILNGSKVRSSFQMGEFKGSTVITVEKATRYQVENEMRNALVDGEISYELIETELNKEELQNLKNSHPLAEWYRMVAYEQTLVETIGFTFDDLRYGLRHSKNWSSKKVASGIEYRFTVPGTKASDGDTYWYGASSKSSVQFTVMIDSKKRITALKIVGPSKKQPESNMVKISYGPNKLTTPNISTVISWEELVIVVPRMAPLVVTDWEKVEDLALECVEALTPLRKLMDMYHSGVEIKEDKMGELNEALNLAKEGCIEIELNRFYDLEFFGWFYGFKNEK